MSTRCIIIPRHPEDAHIPDSVMNIVLPSGRIATVTGPLFSNTMDILVETLMTCKEAMVDPTPNKSTALWNESGRDK